MRKRPLTSVLVFFCMFMGLAACGCHALMGQNIEIRGRVTDAAKGSPLAFVHIVPQNSQSGTMTDIDGNFILHLSHEPDYLQLSYVGYTPLQYKTQSWKSFQQIRMEPARIELTEVVVVAGENPAHRIINRAIANKDRNDPEKLSSFSYTSYSKFVLTVDSTYLKPDTTAVVDSLKYQLRRFTERNHFMLVESVSERYFKYPNRNSERVLASRISGFSNPLFAIVATQLQSFSIYPDFINLAGKDYIGPLSRGSTSRYFFNLEDTLYQQADTIFVIAFRPAKGRNFEGLKGLLYIHTDGFAVQNVITEPAETQANLSIKVQQMYAKAEQNQWFPLQLNTFIGIKNFQANGVPMYGETRSYLSEIQINTSFSNKVFSGFDLEIPPDTKVRDEAFFNLFRADSLSWRDKNTYRLLDSLGLAHNFDYRMQRIESLMEGFYPGRILDLDLRRLLAFNKYEGFRAGLGFRTSPRLSNLLTASAWYGYGFKDKAHKYGAGLEMALNKRRSLHLGASFSVDLRECGGSNFLEPHNILGGNQLRSFYVDNMESVSARKLYLKGLFPKQNIGFELSSSLENIQHLGSYTFLPGKKEGIPNTETQSFVFFENGIRVRWAPWEKLLSSGRMVSAVASDKPVFYFNFSNGMEGVLDSDFSYIRAELCVKGSISTLKAGKLSWQAQGGYVWGEVPWSRLFTAPALSGGLSVAAPATFATVGMDEYVSSRHAALFLSHNLGPLWRNKKVKAPELLLKGAYLIGSLSHLPLHLNRSFSAPEKGLAEVGLGLDKLLRSGFSSIGVESMYRIGAYSHPEYKKNLGFRLIVSVNL